MKINLDQQSGVVSAVDLGEVIFPEGGQGVVVFLKVYADESYDNTVYCCGSLLGWPKNFYYLGLKWQDRLDQDGLKYFHASDHAKNDALRGDLVRIIQSDPAVAGSSFSVVRKDFTDLVSKDPKAKEHFGTDPMVFAYKRLIRDTVTLMEKDFPDPPVKIAFVFDEHTDWKKAQKAYEGLKEEDPACAKRMLCTTHADDKQYPGLQMADLMASEARQDTKAWLKATPGQRPALEALKKTHNVYFMGVRNRENLLADLAGLPDLG